MQREEAAEGVRRVGCAAGVGLEGVYLADVDHQALGGRILGPSVAESVVLG